MKRELLINEKKLKELVSKALKKNYKEITIAYNDRDELVLEVKQGHFTEHVPFFNEKILRELNIQDLGLNLDYVSLYENEYAYVTDATDEQRIYIFYCNNSKEVNEVKNI